MQEQVSSKTKPAWALLRRIGFAGRHSPRTTVGVEGSSKAELVCIHASRCWLLRKQQKFLPPNPCPEQKPVKSHTRLAPIALRTNATFMMLKSAKKRASNLLFTVLFRLPIIIRYPSMWLLSSAIHVPPCVRRASASRHTSFGLWPLILAPTGCAWSIERMCDSRKARAAMRTRMAHNTITVLGVIDVSVFS